jgi:hypothetical protein
LLSARLQLTSARNEFPGFSTIDKISNGLEKFLRKAGDEQRGTNAIKTIAFCNADKEDSGPTTDDPSVERNG